MLLKMLPEQIERQWPTIAFGIEQSLPAFVGLTRHKMNAVLQELLAGDMHAWIVSDPKRQGVEKFAGIVITAFNEDKALEIKDLMIYALYNYRAERFSDLLVLDGFRALQKFAASNGCSRITAYTDSESLLDRAEEVGAKVTSFISMEV